MAIGDEIYEIAEKAKQKNKISGVVLVKLLDKIEEKNSWGKEQLKQEMLKILVQELV